MDVEARAREDAELREMVEQLDLFSTPSKLATIEPEKWRNVGVSIMHSNMVLKEHCLQQTESLKFVTNFITRFSKKITQNMKMMEFTIAGNATKAERAVEQLDKSI